MLYVNLKKMSLFGVLDLQERIPSCRRYGFGINICNEYNVIDNLIKTSIRPKQILAEFHHRFEDVGLYKTKKAVKQLENT